MNKLNNLKETVNSSGEEATTNLENFVDSLKEKMSEVSGNLKESATDLGQKALDQTKSLQSKVAECIINHPYKSVGIAFLVGLIYAKYKSATKAVLDK